MRNVQLFKSRWLLLRRNGAEPWKGKTKRQVGYEWSEYRWRRGDEESYVAKDEELSEEM